MDSSEAFLPQSAYQISDFTGVKLETRITSEISGSGKPIIPGKISMVVKTPSSYPGLEWTSPEYKSIDRDSLTLVADFRSERGKYWLAFSAKTHDGKSIVQCGDDVYTDRTLEQVVDDRTYVGRPVQLNLLEN